MQINRTKKHNSNNNNKNKQTKKKQKKQFNHNQKRALITRLDSIRFDSIQFNYLLDGSFHLDNTSLVNQSNYSSENSTWTNQNERWFHSFKPRVGVMAPSFTNSADWYF